MAKAAAPVEDSTNRPDVARFIQQIWFLLMYFALLLMIASFGLIAES
ncbi:MAG: hypothetical protein AB7P76_02615 [Candidatus Melainabacteria bacterium]